MQGKKFWGLSTALAALGSVWLVLLDGLSEEGIRQLIRLSVDVAFVFFFFSVSASAWHHFLKNRFSQYLVRNRRYLGLSFATLFLWHGALIYSLAVTYPEPFFSTLTDETLYAGLLTFAVVALMAVTSNDGSVKRIGRKTWARLHTVGGYFIATLFMLTYLGKLDEPFFWPHAIAAIGVFALRGFKRVGVTAAS